MDIKETEDEDKNDINFGPNITSCIITGRTIDRECATYVGKR